MLRYDAAIDRLVAPLRRSRPITRATVYLTNSAVYSAIWLVICGVGALIDQPRRTTWGWIALGLVIEFALTNGPVKQVFRRRRPIDPLDGEWVKGLRRPRTSSFPSGHASAAGFMIGTTAGLVPLWPVIAVVGVAIAVTRVFLRLHHASDITAGMVWGAVVGVIWRLIVF